MADRHGPTERPTDITGYRDFSLPIRGVRKVLDQRAAPPPEALVLARFILGQYFILGV